MQPTTVLVGLVLVFGLTQLYSQRQQRIDAEEHVEDLVYALRRTKGAIAADEETLKGLRAANALQRMANEQAEKSAGGVEETRRQLEEVRGNIAQLRATADRTRMTMENERGRVLQQVGEAEAGAAAKAAQLRGLRVSLDRQEQLNEQLRGSLAAALAAAGVKGVDVDDTFARNVADTRGVIIYTVSRKQQGLESMRTSLLLLELNVLRCYPHPIVLFVEHDVEQAALQQLAAIVPSATSFSVENVCFETCVPPGYAPSSIAESQANKGAGPGFAARSRFYSGLMHLHPALEDYDYYWRLDTDSFILDKVTEDPFARMRHDGCLYGFNAVVSASLDPANKNTASVAAARRLHTTVSTFLAMHTSEATTLADHGSAPEAYRAPVFPDETLVLSFGDGTDNGDADDDDGHTFRAELFDGELLWKTASFPLANVSRMLELVGATNDSYNGILYGTHFEIAAFEPYRRAPWQAVFRAIDVAHGWYKDHWSDALVRAFAVPLLLPPESVCYLGHQRVNYAHGHSDFSALASSILQADANTAGGDECFPPVDESLDRLPASSYFVPPAKA